MIIVFTISFQAGTYTASVTSTLPTNQNAHCAYVQVSCDNYNYACRCMHRNHDHCTIDTCSQLSVS